MNSIKIYKEEFDTNRTEIERAESLWGKKFPKEYVEFLLQNNGAVVYPNWPNLGPDNKTEIWGIERFFSIGDVVIQKMYPMTYTLHDIDEENFEEHNLSPDDLLVFAQGDRGVYLFNLAIEEYGQIYIANFSGGDGISRTSTNSFNYFISSLGLPEWDEDGINTDFEFSNELHSQNKILQWHLYYSPENPELGFNRFKEVFEYCKEINTRKDDYSNIIYKYVDERLKLDYLIQQGCDTSALLRGASKAETIRYLVNDLNLDINKSINGRYPLQNYLSASGAYVRHKYKLVHKLLEMGIEMDWSIRPNKPNGEPELPMIEKLRILHDAYLELELKEQEFRKKYKKPSGSAAIIDSKYIKQKLGIIENKSWLNQLFKRNNER
jgi:hypothetical protein